MAESNVPQHVNKKEGSYSGIAPRLEVGKFNKWKKRLMAKTFNCNEKEVSNDEEMVQVKVLMALVDDALVVGKNHVRNGEWIDIIMRKFVEEQRLNLSSKYNKLFLELNKRRDGLLVFKQAKLEAVTFQLQNNELIKQNHAL
ncbi:hypothetical protein Tco_1209207 [Tanacetum coccineum]